MPDRLEVIQLAIELRDAANALAKLTCDTRIPDETIAAYLEAEVRPDYRALRRALKPQDGRIEYRGASPSPQVGEEPGATAVGESESAVEWAKTEEFLSRTRDQRRSP